MAEAKRQTGIEIVSVQGPGFDYVGAYSAEMIDKHTADLEPNSPADHALLWINGLLQSAGRNPSTLNEIDAGYANSAQQWYLFIHYWELSRLAENCPAGCKDPDKYFETLNSARKKVCQYLRELGLTDPEYCDNETNNSNSMLKAFRSRGYNTCRI